MPSNANSPSATRPEFLSSYGRNRGRSLRPYQQGLIDTLLPKLALDQAKLALPVQPLSLEIGFGGGEHLLAQALHNPQRNYIGCEPFLNGVAKLLTGIDQHKLSNIRLFTQDARLLVKALPDACLDEIFILFPDPWPKLRHNKRRLVNGETLKMLARAHKKGGRLLIATDHVDYASWILEQLLLSPDYAWTAKEKADWLTPPADWTQTKYQRKTTEQGRNPQFFECIRK